MSGNKIATINSFLTELADNNNREWMAEQKATYQDTRKVFQNLISEVINGIAAFDEGVSAQEAKKAIFRLHRDTRFSNDKSPYKLNYGASVSKGGRKSPYASYYIHLKPGENFIGGGMYRPDAEVIKKIRQEIDYNSGELLEIIEKPDFKGIFGRMEGEQLKTAPKGYPKDHPQIELLRHKDFYFRHQIDESELSKDSFVDHVLEKFKVLHPFIQYMNTAID